MIGDRIREARERKGMTQDDLAKRLGYESRGAVYKIESGRNDVKQRMIPQLAEILGVSISYLLETNDKDYSPKPLFERAKCKAVPVYSGVSCGSGSWVAEEPEDYLGVPEGWIQNSGEYFSNPADGDSMEPKIHNGDYVVFECTNQVDSGQIGAFALNSDYYCKRFKRLADGSVWLFSENPEYEPIPVRATDDFRVLGAYRCRLTKD